MIIHDIHAMNKSNFEDSDKSIARNLMTLLDKYIAELEKENEILKKMNSALQEQIINIQNGKTQYE
jgi:hypothetical protein